MKQKKLHPWSLTTDAKGIKYFLDKVLCSLGMLETWALKSCEFFFLKICTMQENALKYNSTPRNYCRISIFFKFFIVPIHKFRDLSFQQL